ncbi:Arc family DNA-binding protein [Rhizobium leucaenae]|uniref:Arc family DNA-binding protein n=1 Tax=Rhizobium leucaenae TaxID=29450 RepID=UPI000B278F67|nr:Arc family DNA-binding protein [Rhizobium leucaenae]
MRTDQSTPKLQVRLTPETKAFIEAEARKNGSSQNSEIIRCIREKMDRLGIGLDLGSD